MTHEKRTWWKEGILYQIYPRSFFDSNGDGIGDIPGICEKLDYIADLGVSAVWLSPIYTSPQYDNGYDVADYRNIDPMYGTLEEWQILASELHSRGIHILGDLVANHSSHQHPWFHQASSSIDNKYHDYYIWHPGEQGRSPSDHIGFFQGNAWEWNEATREYYLHMFLKEQPDLNWDNPAVRKEMLDVVKFWKDCGIDGFRIDVANAISKDTSLFSKRSKTDTLSAFDFLNGPRLQEYLQELCQKTRAYAGDDFLMLGECPEQYAHTALPLIGYENDALNLLYSFDLTKNDLMKSQEARDREKNIATKLRKYFTSWLSELYGKAWLTNYFNNHDLPRVVSKFGNDTEYREQAAKAFLSISLFAHGTPILFQGEELGMTNYPFTSFDDFKDVDALHFIEAQRAKGLKDDEILEIIRPNSRDNSRTPMQWDNSPHAGFTTGTPWLSVNPNFKTIHASAQRKDPQSIYAYTQKLITYRKTNPSMVYGDMNIHQPHSSDEQSILVFSRSSEQGKIFVCSNLSSHYAPIPRDIPSTGMKILCSNYIDEQTITSQKELRPWESTIFIETSR